MKKIKKVSNNELINCLLQSLEYNTEALDYMKNEISRLEDLLKYNSNDAEVSRILKIYKYIEFSLKFLDDSYNESLKKLGVFK